MFLMKHKREWWEGREVGGEKQRWEERKRGNESENEIMKGGGCWGFGGGGGGERQKKVERWSPTKA